MKIFQKKQNLSKNHESLQTFNQVFNSTCWVSVLEQFLINMFYNSG